MVQKIHLNKPKSEISRIIINIADFSNGHGVFEKEMNFILI